LSWSVCFAHVSPHLIHHHTLLTLLRALLQGPSPDEVALVEAARQMGFEFKRRAQSSVVLNMLGEEVVYEVLNVMEYSSDRSAGEGGWLDGWIMDHG
jgi:magnesium-transporting ATPase (P-type)